MNFPMSKKTLQGLKAIIDLEKHKQEIQGIVYDISFRIAEAASKSSKETRYLIDMDGESLTATLHVWEVLIGLREKFPDSYIEYCSMVRGIHDGKLHDICTIKPEHMDRVNLDVIKDMIVVDWS
jgi:hypothetical protein